MHLNSKMVAMLKGLRPGVLNLDVISFVFVLMLNLITSRMALFEIDALSNSWSLRSSDSIATGITSWTVSLLSLEICTPLPLLPVLNF